MALGNSAAETRQPAIGQPCVANTQVIPHLPRMAGTRILLVDNGSYEPAATLALRGLAKEVGLLIGQEVRPVSTTSAPS